MADKYNFDSFDSIVSQYQEPQAPDEISQTESLLRGAAQGASFGFADEATAGLESLLRDIEYQKALEESRQAYKQAEEQNPMTYLAGNVAGGIAVPMPGTAALSGVKGLTGLARAKALATTGAAAGGLAAAGTTEEDLLSKEGLKDVATGVGTGSVIAPVIGQSIPALAGRAKDWWLSQRSGRDIASIFQKSMQDPDFASVENFKRVGKELSEDVEEKFQPAILKEAKQTVKEAYEKPIEVAKQSGELVPTQEVVSKTMNTLESATTQNTENFDKGVSEITKIVGSILKKPDEDIIKGALTPDDLLNLRDEGEYLFTKYGNPNTNNFDHNVAQAGLELKQSAKSGLNKLTSGAIESADKVQAAHSEVMGILNMNLPSPGKNPIAYHKALVDNQKAIKEMFVRQYKNFDTDEQRRLEKAFNTLVDAKLMPKQQAEDLFKGMGQKAYERYLLANMHDISELATDMWSFFGIPLNARGKAYQFLGGVGGATTGAAQRGIKKMAVDWPKNIYNKTPEDLQKLANAFGRLNSPWTNALKNAATAPEAKRKALMFTLMQQPSFRDSMDSLVENIVPVEETPNE